MYDLTATQMQQEAKRLSVLLCKVTDFKTGKKFSYEDCLKIAPLSLRINQLKKENNALILAHYYCTPDIVYGVADFKGDSYALASKAVSAKEKNIIFCGVYFMAQTAKIVNPNKNVFLPPVTAGCSLADGISVDEIKELKQKYPAAAFVCYINSTAEVKAYCDVCVTSSNVYDIVAKLPQKQIVFVPDLFMAENIRTELKDRGIEKEVFAFGSTCCVHDKYTLQDIEEIKKLHPLAKIISHPECAKEVSRLSDYCGSTSGMLTYVKNSKSEEFAVLSENGIINSLELENPSKRFYPSGRTCAQMKRNTLLNILGVLENLSQAPKVDVSAQTALKAKKAIDNMFKMAGK